MFSRYSKYASKLQVKSDRFPNLYLDGELWYFSSVFLSLFSMFIFLFILSIFSKLYKIICIIGLEEEPSTTLR